MPTLRQLIKSAEQENKRYIIYNNSNTHFKKLMEALHLRGNLQTRDRIDINGKGFGKSHIWLMDSQWIAYSNYTALNATDVRLIILKKETNE